MTTLQAVVLAATASTAGYVIVLVVFWASAPKPEGQRYDR